jgi:bis(5'-nucleosyl)-tetraphosphatase (symmetrical)
MDYLVGDLQGCCDALDRLIDTISFSPSRDRLYVLGDLVNRGPRSLDTLRRLRGLGDAAMCLIGNHDLSLLAVAHGLRRTHKGDTLDDILQAPDRHAWIDWLRHRRLAFFDHGWLMVHAGVVPQWDLAQTLALASEVEGVLQGDDLGDFLKEMYGDEPLRWDEKLSGHARLRLIVNVLTRIRFVAADGTLDLHTKEGAGAAPAGFYPWFDAPGRRTAGVQIACGHWSSIGFVERRDLLAIDTGCIWGRQLTAVRIDGGRRDVVQIDCAGLGAK